MDRPAYRAEDEREYLARGWWRDDDTLWHWLDPRWTGEIPHGHLARRWGHDAGRPLPHERAKTRSLRRVGIGVAGQGHGQGSRSAPNPMCYGG